MTKNLEDFFDLPSDTEEEIEIEETKTLTKENVATELQPVHDAIALRDKIDAALETVSNFKQHDNEMDDIALKAIESYEQLMETGMNMTDMAAGNVFGNAAQMLKIAKDAKDSKVDRKLKQLDLMMKKLRLDQYDKKDEGGEDGSSESGMLMDRNEILAQVLKGIKDEQNLG